MPNKELMSFAKAVLLLFGIIIGTSLAKAIIMQYSQDMSPSMVIICKVMGAGLGGFIGLKLVKFVFK